MLQIEMLRGMYFRLKRSFWRENVHVSELILNNLSFMNNSSSYVNIWDLTIIGIWKIEGSVLMFPGKLNLEYLLGQV